MLKKLFCVILALVITASLSGCALPGADIDSLIAPPKPTGELYEIRKALEKSVKEKFTLKYPTSGDIRSAIVEKDFNNDGAAEAVAFYSTVKDNIVSMNINFIKKSGEEWISGGSFKIVAAGVESVLFKDLDGDNIDEIIVGWSVYGNIDKILGVYSVASGSLTQRINESYTNYLCSDLNNDGKNELFLTSLSFLEEALAAAKLYSLEVGDKMQVSTLELDSAVSAYSAPVAGKLSNGNSAIYLDAIKGVGAITEVLEVEDKTLKNALLNEAGVIANTYRTTGAAVRDIDGDGIYEIPLVELITAGDEINEGVYRTDWHTVENGGLTLKSSTIMNYNDGYFIVIPEKWQGKITVTRDTANRIRNFMRIDSETGNSAELLVRIQVTAAAGGASEDSAAGGATLIAESAELKFYATLGAYKGAEAVTLDELKQYFKLIK